MQEKLHPRLVALGLFVTIGSVGLTGCGQTPSAEAVSNEHCYTGQVGNTSVWQGVRTILKANGYTHLESLNGANGTAEALNDALIEQHQADGHNYSALPEDKISVCVSGHSVSAGDVTTFGK